MIGMPLTRETIERTDGSLALVAGPYLDPTYGEDYWDTTESCPAGAGCYWISAEEHQWLAAMRFDGDDPDEVAACHWDPVLGKDFVPF